MTVHGCTAGTPTCAHSVPAAVRDVLPHEADLVKKENTEIFNKVSATSHGTDTRRAIRVPLFRGVPHSSLAALHFCGCF